MNEVKKRFFDWSCTPDGIDTLCGDRALTVFRVAKFFDQFDGYKLVPEKEPEPVTEGIKIAHVLTEQIALRERIAMLEGIVQQLTGDVMGRLDALEGKQK